MNKTLLEKAKEVVLHKKRLSNFSDEQIELAIAWMTGKITLKQFTVVMWDKSAAGSIGGKALYTIASMLRDAYLRGKLKIK